MEKVNDMVRIGNERDIAFFVESAVSMMKETEGKNLPAESVQSGVRKVLASSERGFYVVAQRGPELVGSMLIAPLWVDLSDGCFWWLQCVHVRPAARKQGYFRAMFEFVRDRAEASPDVRGLRLRVHPSNSNASKLYEGVGMSLVPYDTYEMRFA